MQNGSLPQTNPPRVGVLSQLSVHQLRRIYRRAVRRGSINDRRAARATDNGARQIFLRDSIQCDHIVGAIRVECARRGIMTSFDRPRALVSTNAITWNEKIVFAWTPKRLSVRDADGFWFDVGTSAWLRKVKKVVTSEGTFYTEIE